MSSGVFACVQVVWVCQQQPCSQLAGLIDRCGLRVSLHINPPQVTLCFTLCCSLRLRMFSQYP